MNCYELAFRYLWRKKTKTLILLLVFLAVNSVILSGNMILRAAENAKTALQKKTGSKVTAEAADETALLTEDEMERIGRLKGVSWINRLGQKEAVPSGFQPVTGSQAAEEENLTVTLQSCDDMEKDSVFSQELYRLTEGRFGGAGKPGAVVNGILAKANGLKIGDRISFETGEGETRQTEIVGIFAAASNSEARQPETTGAADRIENQIFVDSDTFEEICGGWGFYKAVVYTDDPERLGQLADEIGEVLGEKAETSTSDALYRQMEAPLEKVVKMAGLLLLFAVFGGTAAAGLLLCMWMRARQKEQGVLISLGKRKASIFLQVFLESLTVFGLSLPGAWGLGSAMAKGLGRMVSGSGQISMAVSLTVRDLASLALPGGAVLVAAVALSLIPAAMTKPGELLSKMEG